MWMSWCDSCDMKKYFGLQLKRAVRFLPLALCVMAVLFGCLTLAHRALTAYQNQQDQTKSMRIKVGVVGTAGDQYLQWGLAAMQFDSTAMSIEMVQLEEQEAINALEKGRIAAFVVFPENFVGEALYGNVQQLRFVTTVGATGLTSILKEEITSVVDRIMVACQRGSYGVGDALTDQGRGDLWGQHVNGLALEYVDFLFDRSKIYRVESLTQDNVVTFPTYMLGGLMVLLMMLGTLVFAPLYIRHDLSLARLLRTKGIGLIGQVTAEFGGYFLMLAVLLAAVTAVMGFGGMLSETTAVQLFAGILPTLAMVAALSYLLFTLSGNLIGGVLLTFFLVLALGFAGGCMYPVQVFPDTMQQIAAILPSGMARMSVISVIQGGNPTCVGPLLAWAGGCLVLSVAICGHKIGRVRG